MKFYDKALRTNIPPADSNIYDQLRSRVAIGIYETEHGEGSFSQIHPHVAGKDWQRYLDLAEGALTAARKHQHHPLKMSEDPKQFPTIRDNVLEPAANGVFRVIMVILFPILWPIVRLHERAMNRDYEEHKAEEAAREKAEQTHPERF
jgi:hypothetical protein